jgi:hypothetical protein
MINISNFDSGQAGDDSDAALDAALGAADDDMLTAVSRGLDLDKGMARILKDLPAAAGTCPDAQGPACPAGEASLAAADQSKRMESPPADGLPHYRCIVALDIESSTTRPNPVKGELRNKVYELFEMALCTAGISRRDRDRFIDRGDGILSLIHPVDQSPKALLLNRAIPLLSRLLAEYNGSLPRHSRPQRQLRIRVVLHAGEVHYDANGCFGEALDVAFRLLDAARVTRALRETADPLVLIVSEDIHSSVVRQDYNGRSQESFHPLVRVRVAGRRYPGWIQSPEQGRPLTAAQLARNQRLVDHYQSLA